MATSPLTSELEAVNSMLTAIGNSPVTTLEGTLGVDVVTAKDILAEVSRKCQTKGWHFNTEYDYPLMPNVDGEITLPPNTLRVDTESHNHTRIDVVQRGTRLYNKYNRSYKFDTTIYATMVLLLEFEELPEVVRQYIFTQATKTFGNRMIGDIALDGFSSQDVFDAMATMKESEGDTADHNIFDSADTSAPLFR